MSAEVSDVAFWAGFYRDELMRVGEGVRARHSGLTPSEVRLLVRQGVLAKGGRGGAGKYRRYVLTAEGRRALGVSR